MEILFSNESFIGLEKSTIISILYRLQNVLELRISFGRLIVKILVNWTDKNIRKLMENLIRYINIEIIISLFADNLSEDIMLALADYYVGSN